MLIKCAGYSSSLHPHPRVTVQCPFPAPRPAIRLGQSQQPQAVLCLAHPHFRSRLAPYAMGTPRTISSAITELGEKANGVSRDPYLIAAAAACARGECSRAHPRSGMRQSGEGAAACCQQDDTETRLLHMHAHALAANSLGFYLQLLDMQRTACKLAP